MTYDSIRPSSEQRGHPVLRASSPTRYRCWPFVSPEHNHHTFLRDFAVTSTGVKSPLHSLSHSEATSRLVVARSLTPGIGFLPEQYGQPLPRFRLFMTACHSWLWTHTHHTFLFEPGLTSHGVRGHSYHSSILTHSPKIVDYQHLRPESARCDTSSARSQLGRLVWTSNRQSTTGKSQYMEDVPCGGTSASQQH